MAQSGEHLATPTALQLAALEAHLARTKLLAHAQGLPENLIFRQQVRVDQDDSLHGQNDDLPTLMVGLNNYATEGLFVRNFQLSNVFMGRLALWLYEGTEQSNGSELPKPCLHICTVQVRRYQFAIDTESFNTELDPAEVITADDLPTLIDRTNQYRDLCQELMDWQPRAVLDLLLDQAGPAEAIWE